MGRGGWAWPRHGNAGRGRGEGSGPQPGASGGGGEEVGGVSGLEDGRNQLEGLNGGTGGMATWWIVWAQEMECGGRAAGTGPALGSGL